MTDLVDEVSMTALQEFVTIQMVLQVLFLQGGSVHGMGLDMYLEARFYLPPYEDSLASTCRAVGDNTG
ncbi:hypothetical protein [Dyella mobilis]|uniref:Uncharacterized protein n=1 Tax=Dyella mobilis TaxID=1849582 RepID=A0ABS2KF88_9GAMM|nr:hypothetical protein [Dyella mobilis]MBM7129038.1 hypothetical protein [Dyella mobilis]